MKTIHGFHLYEEVASRVQIRSRRICRARLAKDDHFHQAPGSYGKNK